MKLLQLLFLTVSAYTILSCKNKSMNPGKEVGSSPQLLVFDRLLGTWQSEDGKIFERWIRNEDGSFNSVVSTIYLLKMSPSLEFASLIKRRPIL